MKYMIEVQSPKPLDFGDMSNLCMEITSSLIDHCMKAENIDPNSTVSIKVNVNNG